MDIFVFVGLFSVLGLHLYYEHRARKSLNRGIRQAAHHCIRCDTIYSAPRDDGLHACPTCGQPNPRLKY